MARLRWGVLSTAGIGRLVIEATRAADHAEFVAVASRDAVRARAFAGELGLEASFGSYEELLASSQVDAVYVPLPVAMHTEWTVKALEAGKHVLCEKPFATSAADAARCFDAAEAAGRYCVEGLMYRHHPQTTLARQLVAGGAIGRLAATLRLPADVLAQFDVALDLTRRDELELVGTAGRLTVPDPWLCRATHLELSRDGQVEHVPVDPEGAFALTTPTTTSTGSSSTPSPRLLPGAGSRRSAVPTPSPRPPCSKPSTARPSLARRSAPVYDDVCYSTGHVHRDLRPTGRRRRAGAGTAGGDRPLTVGGDPPCPGRGGKSAAAQLGAGGRGGGPRIGPR
jgi:Oxidoreductase family, NAD-binding Rossmann fold